MRSIVLLAAVVISWCVLPACSGGTKGPSATTSPEAATSEPSSNPSSDEPTEGATLQENEPGEPASPEIVMEVIKTLQ